MSDDGGWDEFADGVGRRPGGRRLLRGSVSLAGVALRERGRTLDGMQVLDFGCGTGLLTERLADRVAAIDAMDTSPAMLRVLRDKVERAGWANVRVLAELPAGAESYDLIVASSVCSFLDEYPGTVAHLVSLLRTGWHVRPVGLGTRSRRRATRTV